MVRRRVLPVACALATAALGAPATAGAGPVSNLVAPVQGVVDSTVPGPVANTVDNAANAVSGTVDGVVGSLPTVPRVPSVPSVPTPATGGSGSSGAGSGSPGASSGGGGGSTSTGVPATPGRAGSSTRAAGGSRTARRRATGGRSARTRATRIGRASAASRAAGGGAPIESRTSAAPTLPPGARQGPVTKVINRIENVIPTPIWVLVGLLALLALGFAARSRLVSLRARRLERQREELLGDVGLLQRALLPGVPDGLGGVDVSVAYRPADGPAAGGDFYDVFALDADRTAVIVGDVCGHGRDALAVTALMRYTLRAYLGAGFEPRIALQIAGQTIDGDPDAVLTTVVLAVYDAQAGTLTYACAGHQPPIVAGDGAREPVTVFSSPPLAGPLRTGQRQTTIPLPPGTVACFFTDGLVEARIGQSMVGRDRLAALVAELQPEHGAQELLARVAQAADRTPDDMAACVVRARDGAVSAPAGSTEELDLEADELRPERIGEFLEACGVAPERAGEAVKDATAKTAEFGGALVVVRAGEAGTTVETKARDAVSLPIPSLAEARRQAAASLTATA